MGAIDYECREAIRRLVSMLDDPNGFHDAELAHVLAALDAAPDPAPGPRYPGETGQDYWFRRGGEDAEGQVATADPAPDAGAMQVFSASEEQSAPPPPALPGPVGWILAMVRAEAGNRFQRGDDGADLWRQKADELEDWARALPPALDEATRALMLDARMAVLGYRDTIRRGSSPEASSFRDRMDALASALRAAAGPTP